MSKRDETGLKLIAHFNRMGDVQGLKLFYDYNVEVEVDLKEKRVLTVERSPLPKNGNSIMDRKARNEKMFRVVEQHHVSESNARYGAKRLLTWLRSMEYQERMDYAADKTFLEAAAKGYKVKPDHVQLFVEMVQNGVKDESVADRG